MHASEIEKKIQLKLEYEVLVRGIKLSYGHQVELRLRSSSVGIINSCPLML